ncbi:MAG: FAD-binding oxidoreductase [Flavobacteriales bacterium]|nr:FAD-binding oxidoreductase [Flavobacteriales bacterium]
MFSYWEKRESERPFDILIIGGGITGYSAAIECKMYRPDIRVGLLEKSNFETTASTKNAGFACFGSITEMLGDLKRLSEDDFCDLVRNRWEGLRLLRQRAGDQHMRFNECGGYEVFRSKEEYEKAASSIAKLNNLLRSIVGPEIFRDVIDQGNFQFEGVHGMIVNRYEGQLDPARMMARLRQLARGLDVEYYTAEAMNVEERIYDVKVNVGQNDLIASQVVIAVNGLASKFLDLDVKPARAQVLITEPIEELGWQGTFHYDEGYYYFRNVGERVLLGGGRNLDFAGEETTSLDTTSTIQVALEKLLSEVIIPNREFKIDRRWAGTMGVGPVKEPIVKHVSERVISAVRLGGMGVAIGSLVGSRAAHLAVG